MTEHIRWNHDKTFTLITMKKSWQNIYAHYDEEIMTKHLRSLRWRSHENSWGEKRGEKRGEISPLHLNIIFGSFTLITKKKFRQNIYDEIMTKHLRSCLTKHIRSLRWWNHDKTYTLITMKKSWQNIYAHYDEEIMTKHVRSCLLYTSPSPRD